MMSLAYVVGHILAVCLGLSLGLVGGGGSILAVPILVYVLGIGSKTAIAMSLVVVGLVSLVGAIPHSLQGNVNLKIAAIFTPAAMLGAYLGARLTALPFITDTVQFICFGLVMLVASVLMIRQGDKQPALSHTTANEGVATHPSQSSQWLTIPVEGLGVGVLTGFVGVGGGFLIIPTLVLLGGIRMKEAIGTSLLIIAAKSATGFLGYLGQISVDWGLITSFALAASLGTVVGAYGTRYVDGKNLQKGFGYFVLATAIFVLIRH